MLPVIRDNEINVKMEQNVLCPLGDYRSATNDGDRCYFLIRQHRVRNCYYYSV